MHYIEVYFCQQSEFGDSADSSTNQTKFRCRITNHATFEKSLYSKYDQSFAYKSSSANALFLKKSLFICSQFLVYTNFGK